MSPTQSMALTSGPLSTPELSSRRILRSWIGLSSRPETNRARSVHNPLSLSVSPLVATPTPMRVSSRASDTNDRKVFCG
jgi:hypothetical protein